MKRELSASQEKPNTAYILSLVAGIFIVIGGIISLFSVFLIPIFRAIRSAAIPGTTGDEITRMMMGWGSMFGIAASTFGVAFGIVVLYSAVMLNSRPNEHATWGTLVLVFSILSPVGAWAGLGIGMILGITGGALAIGWKPSASTHVLTPQISGKFCVHCGGAMAADSHFCPHCGKEVPR